MAELHVVKKKKSPLPWILLALLVLGIIAYLLLRTDSGVTNTAAPAADSAINYDTAGQAAP